ncbi:MAG: 50S ribosomal protein L18 [Gammaproteobacteria bacterium]|nr:50S ribosomal protein L18 [Gammaproteobacteria bacterium]
MDKKVSRVRRGSNGRMKMKSLSKVRLCIHRTPRHIYAQIISGDSSMTIVSASTLEKEVRDQLKYTGNVSSAEVIGQLIAERALAKGVEEVAFDRSGFKYHGRVKALADSARKGGLKF